MDEEHDFWKEWLQASRVLLAGYTGNRDGLPMEKYISAKDEEYYRMALATVLSTGSPPPDICKMLAALITPDEENATSLMESAQVRSQAGERKLVFQFRKKGRRHDHFRDSEIFTRVGEKLTAEGSNLTVDAAITAVVQEIWPDDPNGKRAETVRKIWQKFKWFREWRDDPEG